jgi:hypothetical protein
MQNQYNSSASVRTNGMAITSLVAGILSWVFALVMACVNWVIVPLFTLATLGIGGLLYLCTGAIACLSPLGWLIGAITGYVAKNQIKQTGERGEGFANAGFIMSLIGLGITILGVCIIAVLAIIGTIQLPNPSSSY